MAKMTKEELVNAIAELTVLELSELVKAIEEKFGVKAAAPAVAVAAAAPAAAAAAHTFKKVRRGILWLDRCFVTRSCPHITIVKFPVSVPPARPAGTVSAAG